uniref:Uncharacterized protein n=1 Tax=Nymphaea colorata TaxID=210225 RepID=A0A5K1CMN9_9MAGN
MFERRLGRGRKAALRRCWCDDGRIRVMRALLTHSPSTVPIRTSEFVMDDLLASSRFDGEPVFLWRLHRKDPG